MPLTGSFVGIGVAPRVASAAAQTQSTVRVVFSEPMTNNAALTTAANYVLTPDFGSAARTVTSVLVASTTIVVLALDGALTPGTDNYQVAVSDLVIDVAANTLDPAFDTADFGFSGAVTPASDEDPVTHIGLLNAERYWSGFGIGWGNFGASNEAPHFLESDVGHAVRARRRLIAQYQGKPNAVATAELIGGRAQTIEDIGVTVRDLHGLDTAFGFLLDDVGERVGLSRQGLEDNTYRTRLAGRIMANVSQGNPEAVRAVLDMLMQTVYDVRLELAPPGVTILRTAQLFQEDGDRFAMTVNRAVPIGTRCIVEWELPAALGAGFGFADDPGAVEWAEFAEDSGDAGVWAEGSDGGV